MMEICERTNLKKPFISELTEAKKLGKSLYLYLLEDVETLNDFQEVYVKGYKDALSYVLEQMKPIMEKMEKFAQENAEFNRLHGITSK